MVKFLFSLFFFSIQSSGKKSELYKKKFRELLTSPDLSKHCPPETVNKTILFNKCICMLFCEYFSYTITHSKNCFCWEQRWELNEEFFLYLPLAACYNSYWNSYNMLHKLKMHAQCIFSSKVFGNLAPSH